MSENPLEFGMVCVVVKLTLCYVFQRVLFFLSCTKVRANEPVTLEIAADITIANCSFPATFIPEAGHDYELQLGSQSSGGSSVCSIKGSEITGGVSKPLLSLRKTGECP